MPELRWTLLIIGVLFIGILAWWERRRPHQASRQDPSWGADVESSGSRTIPHALREPTLTLPEIRTEVRTREPIASRELPVVEIPDEAESEKEIEDELDEISEEISEDASEDAAEDPAEVGFDVVAEKEPVLLSEPEPMSEPMPEALLEPEPMSGRLSVPELMSEARSEPKPMSGGLSVPEPMSARPSVLEQMRGKLSPPVTNVERPIVDWPPEDQRKLVSLRLTARPPGRFRGTLVRQALAAEGFVLGDFGIFHKPDAQNRAVLSAASLTKPGTFDLDTIDTQRFAGLNLFAVLPGPKSPRKAFEELLVTARMLNERLEGALQDERGGPLTPMRIQALRDSLETGDTP